jgi:UDP-N-acetylmuramate dehydrogenase
MAKNIFAELEKELPGIQKNILLKDYTTFKVGGPAKYFFVARNRDEMVLAISAAKKFKLPIFILAGGSNVLISDKGFNGLVIRIEISKIDFFDGKVSAEAGVLLPKFAALVSKKGYAGFEWAVGIPGTVGGAVFGNAQAFGSRISDLVETVEVLDLKNLKFKNLSKEQCKFVLKDSIFKNPLASEKSLVIISVVFNLKTGLENEIKESVRKFLKHRKSRHPIEFPSAGSVFVNPEIKIKNKKLLEKYPELAELNMLPAIPSGYFIEKCGLKGKKKGNAQISEKHANFIINLGGAKAKDILFLMDLAQKKVKEAFGVNLKTEIQRIGF